MTIADDASAVVAYFAANPCTTASVPAVSTFQTDYNASGMPGSLTVTGQYTGNTQAALQNVLATGSVAGSAGPTQVAPTNCFGQTAPTTPGPDLLPGPTVGPGSNSGNTLLLFAAGFAAAGALSLWYAYHLQSKQRRR